MHLEGLKPQSEPKSVTLPVSPSDFRQFISGLLGKPQTITQQFFGAFSIDHQEVYNIHNLLLQRVAQQNEGSLIQFTASITFDDGSSVLLNSIEDFRAYNEIRPLISVQLHLSWSFLVKFQDRDVPEKQQVEVAFVIARGKRAFVPIYEDAVYFPGMPGGTIALRIQHTARTWGADIEALLSGHIKGILNTEGAVREFVRKHCGKLSGSVAVAFFLSAIGASFVTANSLWNGQRAEIDALVASSAAVDEKVTFLLEVIASGLWARFFFAVIVFLILSLVIAVVLGTWVDAQASAHRPSFLLLTKKATTDKVRRMKSYENGGWKLFASFAGSIICGILANYVFVFLSTRLWAP